MFTGSPDEPPGVCFHDNQPLIFVGETAEAQARDALETFLEYWRPGSDRSPDMNQDAYVALPVTFTVSPA